MADTVPGGRYLVNGQWVDAWGGLIPSANPEAQNDATDDPPEFTIEDLDAFTLTELREAAKGRVPGYSNMNKQKLLDALTEWLLGA